MYPECVAFLRKTMRVREIVILVHLSQSYGFAQKRKAFRIHGTAPFALDVKTLSFSDSDVEVWPLFADLCVINRDIFSYRLIVGSYRICCITLECFINTGVVHNHKIPGVKFKFICYLPRSHRV